MKLFLSLFLPLFLSIAGFSYGVGYTFFGIEGRQARTIEVADNATIFDLKQILIERHNLDNVPIEALEIMEGGRKFENDESVTAIRNHTHVMIKSNFRVRGANTKSAR